MKVITSPMPSGMSNIVWASIASHHFLKQNVHSKIALAIPEYSRINELLEWQQNCGIIQSSKCDEFFSGFGPRRTAARKLLFSRQMLPKTEKNIASKCFLPYAYLRRWEFATKILTYTKEAINPDTYFERIASKSSGTVLHVRRGDYVNWRGGLYFFSIEELLSSIPNVKVDYVISDCPDTMITAKKMGLKTTDGTLKSDYEILRSSNHVIGPPSTFNMLGAWLAGADVTWVFREENKTIARSIGKVRSMSCFESGRIVQGPGQRLRISDEE